MKKFLTIALSAILFGAVAGGTILGVNALGNKIENKQAAEISTEAKETEKLAAEETYKLPAKNVKTETESSGDTIAKGETVSGGVLMMDVSDVVEACMPEVVAITNTTVIMQQGYSSFYDYFYGRGGQQQPQEYTQTASGSGVILHETADELLIVTNRHVVEGADELAVTFVDGTTVNADLKGTGSDVDIAVIAIPLSEIEDETKAAIKVAKLHTEEDLKAGQGVIAIGNALGYGQSVTVGVISALDREIEASATETYTDLIQTDAAINPGNSGGALLNNQGELIGINVAKLATTTVEGMGFAIPIYKVADVIEELSNAKTKVEIPEENQGRMGIYMNTISDSQAAALNMPAGVIIMGFSDEVMEGYEDTELQDSPARKAGLLKNDIITKFDGQSVKDAQDLADLVKFYEAGTEVTVTVQRINNGEYEEKEFTVTLGKKTVEKTEDSEEEKSGKDEKPAKDETSKDGKTEKSAKPEEEQSAEEPEEGEEGSGEFEYPDNYGDMYEFFRKYMEQFQ